MYKLDIPLDLKEAAAIERRHKLEIDRQNRVFNSRIRTIGVSHYYSRSLTSILMFQNALI